jgi:hypothetical protein
MRILRRLVAALLAACAAAERAVPGFVFVATHGNVGLRKTSEIAKHDFGKRLAAACATARPVTAIVGSAAEAVQVRAARICRADVRVVANRVPPGATGADLMRALRRFKVAALAAAAVDLLPFAYLDNDAELAGEAAFFAAFDAMAAANASLGLVENRGPFARHPDATCFGRSADDFCERNGGVVLARAGAAPILADWLREFEAAPSVDGHDQASLRTVLLRHRAALYDLPRVFNCRHGNVADADACVVRHGRDWRRAPP